MRESLRCIHQSLRRLRREPVFTTSAVACLALAFGALAGVAAVADALLLSPLPFRDPSRLLAIWKTFDTPAQRELQYYLKPEDFLFLREHVRGIEVAAAKESEVDVGLEGENRRIAAAWATSNLFDLVGIPVRSGRGWTEAEEAARAEVAVVAESFRAVHPAVETIEVEGRVYRIVGEVPSGRGYPDGAVLWMPMRDADWKGRAGVGVVGRPVEGVDLETALSEVRSFGPRLGEMDAGLAGTVGLDSLPIQEELGGDLRGTLLALLTATAIFVLIAAANASSLTLARSVRRQGEVAIRHALGAGTARLMRLQAIDLGIVTLAGLGIGCGLAAVLVRPVLAASPLEIPDFVVPTLDLRILGACAVLATLLAAALLAVAGVGLLPALRSHAAGSAVRSPRHRRTLGLLVVADLAATAVLSTFAWHAVEAVGHLLDRPSGFDLDRVVSVGVSAPPDRNGSLEERVGFFDEVREAARALPGVLSAGTTHNLPMTQPEFYWAFRRARPGSGDPEQSMSLFHAVSSDYLETVGLALEDGRGIRATDGPDAPRVVVVNRSFVERYFPDREPVGESIRNLRGDELLEIVGVVGDAAERGLAHPPEPCVYWPAAQFDRAYLSVSRLVLRVEVPLEAILPALRRRIAEIEPRAVVFEPRTLREDAVASIGSQRFVRSLLGVIAVFALILAAAGVLGLSAYDVATRRRELALRCALGADRWRIRRLLVLEGSRRALAGLLVGGLVVAVAARWPVAAWDFAAVGPASYFRTAALLLGVAVMAGLPSVLRVGRIEIAGALRRE